MKVISPRGIGCSVDSIPSGHCFVRNGVVHMRLSGLKSLDNEIASTVLATGAVTFIVKSTIVTPVNMTAVEAQA